MKYILLLFILFGSSVVARGQSAEGEMKRPKLVVGIVIDQMRMDYIYKYWSRFTDRGFKKLIEDGHLCSNAHYNQIPTYTGPGHANVYTGTTACYNGIIGNNWFDANNALGNYCVGDQDVFTVGGVAVSGKFSPRNLKATTIGDELKLFSEFNAHCFSVSLKDRSAVLGGGHSADGSYWYDSTTGNFVTSSYYTKILPDWVRVFNEKKFSDKIKASAWNTLYSIGTYIRSTEDNTKYEALLDGEVAPVFPHDLSKGNDYAVVKNCPFGNTLLKDFALATVDGNELGEDHVTDLLAISFSATDYIGHDYGTNSIETEDTYLRLDKDLADLILQLEKRVGKDNLLLFLTSDHGALQNPEYLNDRKIPAAFFAKKELKDSLRNFLQHTYGSGDLLAGVVEENIYLNEKLIAEQSDYSVNAVEDAVCKFVMNYEGIHYAYSGHSIRNKTFSDRLGKMIQNAYYPGRSGNVIYVMEANVIEWGYKTGTDHGSGFYYDTHVPLIFYGFGIQQGESRQRVIIDDIAATIASICRITAPNSCTGNPITSVIE